MRRPCKRTFAHIGFALVMGMRAMWLVVLAGCTASVDGHRVASTETHVVPRSAPATSAPLGETLDWLAEEVTLRSAGTEISIAVEDLQTGERFAVGGDTLHVSASSAKAYWVAAALDARGTDAVAGIADPIFRSSDNYASGSAIDLVGTDRVNELLWSYGMTSTALTQWSYGRTRVATNSPRLMGGDNYTSANDAITFLARVGRAEILGDGRGDTLLQWMTLAPRSGVGGWLAARLPADAGVSHKAGWLPPGCCGDDRGYNTLNELGIVTAPDGRRYAVSILARRGSDYWGKQARFVELASCAIYRAFTHDDALVCERAGDPVPAEGCGDVTYQGYCDGDAVVWCENGLQRKQCSSGLTCGWQDDTVGYNCVAPATAGCGDVTYEGYCEDNTVVWCEGDTLRRKDCSAAARTCGYQDAAVGFNCL